MRSHSVSRSFLATLLLLAALFVFLGSPACATSPTPYSGSPVAVSATATTRVEAEGYDKGGEGGAYHDTDNGGCTAYRPDNVGIYQDANASGGYGVYYDPAGEWYGYTLNVAQAGSYAVTARIGANSPGGRFHVEFGPVGGAAAVSTAEFTVPYASGLVTYQDVSVPAVSLPAGPVWMRVVMDDSYPCTLDFFRITPSAQLPTATGLTFNPPSAANGGSVSGAVTLSGPAPGAMTLSLSSDSPSAHVPATVTVYAGANIGYFTATTSPVSAAATAHITASGAGSPVTGSLALSSTVAMAYAVAFQSDDDDPWYVYFGLTGPAPAGGVTVSLVSDCASASVPASVTVPAGSSSGGAPVTLAAVSSPVTAHITASEGGVTKEVDVLIVPFGVAGMHLTPSTVHGGDPVSGYVYLTGPAPAGGVTINMSSDSGSAQVPPSVTIPAGGDGSSFSVTTSSVSSPVTAQITATGPNGPLTATLGLSPLTAPAGLTASAYPTGPATVIVTLNWTAATGASGYVIERSPYGNTVWTQVGTSAVPGYQDTAAAGGAQYWYRVRAAGGSAYSNTVSVSTGFPWLVATDLWWMPAPVHAGDQVHFFTVIQNIGTAASQPFAWSVEFEGDPGETGFNIEANPLAPGDTLLVTEYWNQYWTATPGAYNIAVVINDSYVSLEKTLTVAPAAPTGLTANAVSSSEIDLSWGAVSGATGYAVERSPDGSTGWTQIATPMGTTYQDIGLTAGTTYYYRVWATNGGGASAPSNTAHATTQGTAAPLNDAMSFFTTIRNTNWTCASYGGIRGLGTGTLMLTGVTGSVTHAYLYWHGPTNGDDPTVNATVTFAGHTVVGRDIGEAYDNSWGDANSRTYRADVTSLVTGDGPYSLADFTKAASPQNAAAEINGASLIVFYDGDPGHYRDVTIYNGNDSNVDYSYPDTSYMGVWDETFDNISYPGGDATLYLGVSDGQYDNYGNYSDGEVDINGTILLPFGDYFNGDSVPNGPSAPATHGGLWDMKGYGLTPFLHTGVNTLHLWSGGLIDCLSLVYAVIDQPSVGAAQGPPRPMNLTAVAGDTQVTLSWSPVSGVTYTLSRATSAAGPFQPIATGLTGTTYVDHSVTSGTTYYYYVTATDSFGTSAASNIAHATPPLPDFSLSEDKNPIQIKYGTVGMEKITVNSLHGFAGGVTLSLTDATGSTNPIIGASGDASKVFASFGSNPVTVSAGGSASSSLQLTVGSSVPPGTYNLNVVGTSVNGPAHVLPLVLKVPQTVNGNARFGITNIFDGDVLTGDITIQVAVNDSTIRDAQLHLLIDDTSWNAGYIDPGSSPTTVTFIVRTADLGNSPHTLTITDDASLDTDSRSVTFQNKIQNVAVDAIVDEDNPTCHISADAPDAQFWQVVVQDMDGRTIKTFSGGGRSVNVAWDGTEDNGAAAPYAPYTVSIITQDGNTPLLDAAGVRPEDNGTTRLSRDTSKNQKGDALVILDTSTIPGSDANTNINWVYYQKYIKDRLTPHGPPDGSDFVTGVDMVCEDFVKLSDIRKAIVWNHIDKALRGSRLSVFYVHAHGGDLHGYGPIDPYFSLGGRFWYAQRPGSNSVLKAGDEIVQEEVQNIDYGFFYAAPFVWIDTCSSAGSDGHGNPPTGVFGGGTPTHAWADVFNIDTTQGAFLGSLGKIPGYGSSYFTNDGNLYNCPSFDAYRKQMWQQLFSMNANMQTAYNSALSVSRGVSGSGRNPDISTYFYGYTYLSFQGGGL